MDGAFACPECGCEIRPVGLSPGREVQCDWCRSLVEVPFIPRADQIKRMRRERTTRHRREGYWAWVGLAASIFLVLIVVAGARKAVRSQWQSEAAASLTRLVESSRQAEDAGRLGEAVASLEAAISLAEKNERVCPEIDDLKKRREELARKDAEKVLTEVSVGKPADGDHARAIGRVLTILARSEKDPALKGLESNARQTLDALRTRWVEADIAAAQSAEEAGQPAKALELVSRADTNAGELSDHAMKRWRGEAKEIARRLIGRFGVVLEPTRGQFTLGQANAYDAMLMPLFGSALTNAGYVPRPKSARWEEIWTTEAPYRVVVEVTERQDDTYFSSPNRLSVLNTKMTLSSGTRTLWFTDFFARTTIPVPGLPAYQASRLAVSSHRSPEFEQLLYDNAKANLAERVSIALRNLPALKPTGTTPLSSPTASSAASTTPG